MTDYGDEYDYTDELEFNQGIDPNDHLKAADIESAVTTRTLVINLDTNLSQLAKGQASNVWTIPQRDIQEAIFKRIVSVDPETLEKTRDGDLDKVVILEAQVNWIRNGGPVDMVAKIPLMRGKTFTGTAQDGVAVFLPSKTVAPLAQNKQIFEPENPITRQALANRAPIELEFDESNYFEHPKNKIIEDPRLHKYIVNNASPLGEILHENKHVWGITPKFARGVDEVYSCPKHFIDSVIAQFRDDIKYTSLRDFSVTFERADGQPFNAAAGIAGRYAGHATSTQKSLEKADMENHFNVGFEVELQFVFAD